MSGNNVVKQPQIDLLKIKNAVVTLTNLCNDLHATFGGNHKCKFCPLRAKDSDNYPCYFQQVYDDEDSAEPMEWSVVDIDRIPRLFE